jgi:glycosyltransferase involved in cell wall biosynthesis
MPLTVLNIAFPFAPVGDNAVGGAEQILSDLDGALTAAGHTSLVVACEGSQPSGKLFSFPAVDHQCVDMVQGAVERALAEYRVDLIHMHGFDFYKYTLPPEIPTLVTLHLPPCWYPQTIWSSFQDRVQFQCVSEAQRQSYLPALNDAPVVENGVALPPFRQGTHRGNFALVLGRVCPEKNAHAALEAGTLSGTSVFIGGHVFPYPEHRQYFHEEIEPLLNGSAAGIQHRFLGLLTPVRRQEILAQAKCLLHPTLAPETSSLVAMEAMAAGTPVIAYRSGALPEIVEDGVTGFLVNSVEEMAAAIRKVDAIDPEACRATAERRFSKERMVQDYFRLYRSLLGKRRANVAYA